MKNPRAAKHCCILLMLLFLAWPGHGQAVSSAAAEDAYLRIVPQSYCCVRTATPMRIDGRADEAAWRQALWTAAFTDIQGDLRPAPRYSTRVKMLWDDTHFYVYAEMEEPHVWARLRQRDTVIFYDNDFEIFICPLGTNHTYYEYEVNAYNTVWDLFLPKPYRDGGPADNSWDIAGLRSAVHLRGSLDDASDVDEGWSVEVAIPWSAFDRTALRADGKDVTMQGAAPVAGQHMRVNFSRVEWQHRIEDGAYRKVAGTKEDNWVWSPQGVIDMHRPEKWGWVYFRDALAACRGIGPDPHYACHMALMRVYWAQKAHHKKHGRYAAAQAELRPAGAMQIPHNAEYAYVRRRDGTGFIASYTLRDADGNRVVISVDETSYLSVTGGKETLER